MAIIGHKNTTTQRRLESFLLFKICIIKAYGNEKIVNMNVKSTINIFNTIGIKNIINAINAIINTIMPKASIISFNLFSKIAKNIQSRNSP